MVVVQGVEDADGVRFVGQVGHVSGCCPAEGGCLVVDLEVTSGDLAAEDQGDDLACDVLVDASQGDRLDVESGLLADLAAQAVVDGLAEFENAAGRSQRWLSRRSRSPP